MTFDIGKAMQEAGDDRPNELPADRLERLVELGRRLELAEAHLESLKTQAAEAKAAVDSLQFVDLPESMKELGVTEIRLESGALLKLEEDVKASIPERNRPNAMRWLREHGFSGLIKTEVAAVFDRGDYERAREVAHDIALNHDQVELREVVHPGTLKSFVKEQMQEGAEVPWDLFGAHPFNRVRIKR